MNGFRLGDLIHALERCDRDAYLYFDFLGMQPTGNLFSYRAYYRYLAVQVHPQTRDRNRITVGEFLEQLKAVLDTGLTGYKGGEYKMDRDAFVFATQDERSYEGTIITGVYTNTKLTGCTQVNVYLLTTVDDLVGPFVREVVESRLGSLLRLDARGIQGADSFREPCSGRFHRNMGRSRVTRFNCFARCIE